MKNNLTTFFTVICLILLFTVAAAAQTITVSQKNADKPVKILNKPRVKLGQCSQSSGITKLRVTFDKSAKITEAVIVQSSGCEDFDNNALKAARGIKFKPAIKDGEEVTVIKPVEYTFTIN